MTGREWIDTADCAKLIRKALKREFPTAKFSVRSSRYAGGSSVDVSWTDGPTSEAVNKVAGIYGGADFDGMVDLKTSCQAWLEPDGTATHAFSGGQGSTNPERYGDAPSANSRLVRFGADYVICQRTLSPEFEGRIIEHIEKTFALDTPGNKYSQNARFGNGWASDLIYRISAKTDGDGEIVDGVVRCY
jgi:hypothetical protein